MKIPKFAVLSYFFHSRIATGYRKSAQLAGILASQRFIRFREITVIPTFQNKKNY